MSETKDGNQLVERSFPGTAAAVDYREVETVEICLGDSGRDRLMVGGDVEIDVLSAWVFDEKTVRTALRAKQVARGSHVGPFLQKL